MLTVDDDKFKNLSSPVEQEPKYLYSSYSKGFIGYLSRRSRSNRKLSHKTVNNVVAFSFLGSSYGWYTRNNDIICERQITVVFQNIVALFIILMWQNIFGVGTLFIYLLQRKPLFIIWLINLLVFAGGIIMERIVNLFSSSEIHLNPQKLKKIYDVN